MIFYRKIGDAYEAHSGRVVQPDARNVSLTNLEKFTKYVIRVSAFTKNGNGVSSGRVEVTTGEDGRLAPDHVVTCGSCKIGNAGGMWQDLHPFDSSRSRFFIRPSITLNLLAPSPSNLLFNSSPHIIRWHAVATTLVKIHSDRRTW